MPMWTGGVPSPPELTVPQGMSRSQGGVAHVAT